MYACQQNRDICEPVQVSSASSLRYVLPEIVRSYERLGGNRITLYFASSGAICQQLRSGAPIDLYCSADKIWVERLLEEGFLEPSSVATYAMGKLVLACSEDVREMPLSVASLTRNSFARVAWANPDLAPYGLATQQVLEAAGVDNELAKKSVVGENVGQVLNYLTRGDVDCAFLPLSLVNWSGDRYLEIPSEMYCPIEQVLAVPKAACNRAGALDFARFMLSSQGRKLLAKSGFSLPPLKEL
jgi:molybdate transport system substrate-binding protein